MGLLTSFGVSSNSGMTNGGGAAGSEGPVPFCKSLDDMSDVSEALAEAAQEWPDAAAQGNGHVRPCKSIDSMSDGPVQPCKSFENMSDGFVQPCKSFDNMSDVEEALLSLTNSNGRCISDEIATRRQTAPTGRMASFGQGALNEAHFSHMDPVEEDPDDDEIISVICKVLQRERSSGELSHGSARRRASGDRLDARALSTHDSSHATSQRQASAARGGGGGGESGGAAAGGGGGGGGVASMGGGSGSGVGGGFGAEGGPSGLGGGLSGLGGGGGEGADQEYSVRGAAAQPHAPDMSFGSSGGVCGLKKASSTGSFTWPPLALPPGAPTPWPLFNCGALDGSAPSSSADLSEKHNEYGYDRFSEDLSGVLGSDAFGGGAFGGAEFGSGEYGSGDYGSGALGSEFGGDALGRSLSGGQAGHSPATSSEMTCGRGAGASVGEAGALYADAACSSAVDAYVSAYDAAYSAPTRASDRAFEGATASTPDSSTGSASGGRARGGAGHCGSLSCGAPSSSQCGASLSGVVGSPPYCGLSATTPTHAATAAAATPAATPSNTPAATASATTSTPKLEPSQAESRELDALIAEEYNRTFKRPPPVYKRQCTEYRCKRCGAPKKGHICLVDRDLSPAGLGPAQKQWSSREDEFILVAVAKYGGRWRSLAATLPGRTEDAIRTRWKRLQEQVPREYDLGSVLNSGDSPLPGSLRRSCAGSDCGDAANTSEAWLRGKRIERTLWSAEDDEIILRSVAVFGHKWNRIMALLPGRTSHAIRNRFHRLEARRKWKANRPGSEGAPQAMGTPDLSAFARGRCAPSHAERAAADETARANDL